MSALSDDARQRDVDIGGADSGRSNSDGGVSMTSEWKVPPSGAHKQYPSNLWLRTASIDESGRFTVSFAIPARDEPVRFVDLIEVERQAGIVFAHRHLAVADDAVFMLSEISLNLTSVAGWRDSQGTSGVVEVWLPNPTEKRSPARKAGMQFRVSVEEHRIGRGSAAVRFLPPAIYNRVRNLTRPTPPRSGGNVPRNEGVLLETLPVNLLDPLTEDHSTDHVSGMAVAAAIEKAITARPGYPLRMLSLRFYEYIERHSPAVLRLERTDKGELSGSIEQEDVTKATFSGLLNGHARR